MAGKPQAAMTGNGSGLSGGTSPSVSVAISSQGGDAGRLQQVTDPRGLVSKTDYDLLGRTVRATQAFSSFVPSATSDRTTEFTYDGSNHLLTYQADLSGSSYQKTQYVYGVAGGGSDIYSNDILSAIQYPDKTTGNPSSTEQESYTVNALGQVKTYTDRLSTVHTYGYDVLGRLTSDAVAIPTGSPVDRTVQQLQVAYDTGGRPYLFTSLDATGAVINQVQRTFNGLGQLITEYQRHSSTVSGTVGPRHRREFWRYGQRS